MHGSAARGRAGGVHAPGVKGVGRVWGVDVGKVSGVAVAAVRTCRDWLCVAAGSRLAWLLHRLDPKMTNAGGVCAKKCGSACVKQPASKQVCRAHLQRLLLQSTNCQKVLRRRRYPCPADGRGQPGLEGLPRLCSLL